MRTLLEKLLEPTLILAMATALLYFWGVSSLSGFYGYFGISYVAAKFDFYTVLTSAWRTFNSTLCGLGVFSLLFALLYASIWYYGERKKRKEPASEPTSAEGRGDEFITYVVCFAVFCLVFALLFFITALISSHLGNVAAKSLEASKRQVSLSTEIAGIPDRMYLISYSGNRLIAFTDTELGSRKIIVCDVPESTVLTVTQSSL